MHNPNIFRKARSPAPRVRFLYRSHYNIFHADARLSGCTIRHRFPQRATSKNRIYANLCHKNSASRNKRPRPQARKRCRHIFKVAVVYKVIKAVKAAHHSSDSTVKLKASHILIEIKYPLSRSVGICLGKHIRRCVNTYHIISATGKLAKKNLKSVRRLISRSRGIYQDFPAIAIPIQAIGDIAQRGGISCTCGASGCGMEVQAASVDLVCQQCGGRLRVPAATDDDLDRLCCQYTLTIKGNA